MHRKESESSEKSNKAMKNVIMGLGNLLLDIVVSVPLEFLDKYRLKSDSTTLAEEDYHLELFQEIQRQEHCPKYFPGGCAANTIRVAQWILKEQHVTTFVGAIGQDEEAKKLSQMLNAEGINMLCQKVSEERTGKCAVLITGQYRTLVTQLGASTKFAFKDFVDQDCYSTLENYGVIYISGYFLCVCSRSAKKVAEVAYSKNIPVVLNINAVWVAEKFTKEIQDIMPFIDYLIGNHSEIVAFAKQWDGYHYDSQLTEIEYYAKLSANLPCAQSNKSRTVIITRGTNSVIAVMKGSDESREYNVHRVSQSKIVDTNGAGDAFAGGFIAGLHKQMGLDDCIECGLWAAAEVIQNPGCTFNKDKVYNFNKVREQC